MTPVVGAAAAALWASTAAPMDCKSCAAADRISGTIWTYDMNCSFERYPRPRQDAPRIRVHATNARQYAGACGRWLGETCFKQQELRRDRIECYGRRLLQGCNDIR